MIQYIKDHKLVPFLCFFSLVVGCMGFQGFLTDPWVPKIGAPGPNMTDGPQENGLLMVCDVLDEVSNDELALLDSASDMAPGIEWLFLDGYTGSKCTIRFGDPTRGNHNSEARASTRLTFSRIDGYYKAADAGQGFPGWVAMGEISSCEMIFKRGEPRKDIFAHEFNHCLGRWHVFWFRWMRHWGVYLNRHILSPGGVSNIGSDTRGLTRVPVWRYEEELIDSHDPE